MDELTIQFGYYYLFFGPSDQFVFLTKDIYRKPLWCALLDFTSLKMDLSSLKMTVENGYRITQVHMPWGDIYTL